MFAGKSEYPIPIYVKLILKNDGRSTKNKHN